MAVCKCKYLSIEAKHSKAVLRLIFLIKRNEICRFDYLCKNMSNDAFHFSASIIRTLVSANRFFSVPLFHHFYSKIHSNAHFGSVFSNTGQFNRKTRNAVRFFHYKNENIYQCYAFMIKTDFRTMP